MGKCRVCRALEDPTEGYLSSALTVYWNLPLLPEYLPRFVHTVTSENHYRMSYHHPITVFENVYYYD